MCNSQKDTADVAGEQPSKEVREQLDGGHGTLRWPSEPLPYDDYDDDLGSQWGPASDVETRAVVDPEVEAIKNIQPGERFDGGRGNDVSADVERALADKAISFINEAVGDKMNTRYALLVFHMKDVDPVTTAGQIETISRIGTADNNALMAYADTLADAEIAKMLEKLGNLAPKSLEV